jgi:hypothetical protein
MRRIFFGTMAAVLLLAGSAAAQTITLTAKLTGGAEAPTAVNTGAHGFATVTINRATGEVTWVIDVYNYPTGLTASHIHVGSPGTAGPIIVDFAPANVGQSGSFRYTGSTTTVRPAADKGIRSMEEAMFAIAAGNTYVNVHSQANPGGEIRGQLCAASAEANTISGISVCAPQ